ncbi:MAG: hypothetical protein OEZ06_25410 [Myxococcales bacterium]|nr:hypothetical protein [Myxococcales bacterium]
MTDRATTASEDGTDFGNTTAEAPAIVTAGAGAPAPSESRVDCTGGLYLGTYDCELEVLGAKSPLMGDVSFALEINESVSEGDCDAEFCPDLVIAEGS